MVQTMAQMYLPVEKGGGNIDQKGGKFRQQRLRAPQSTK